MICHNVHWVLRPAFKIAYQLLPAGVGEIMHNTTTKDISKYVGSDQLTSLIEGGLNDQIVLGRPKNGVSFLDVSHKVNIPSDEASKLIEQFRKSLKKNKLELMAYEWVDLDLLIRLVIVLEHFPRFRNHLPQCGIHISIHSLPFYFSHH